MRELKKKIVRVKDRRFYARNLLWKFKPVT